MRLAHLKLTRYGRFTDAELAFPLGEADFHVVYGPNEAGKSTVRNAVTDLLYGLPPRTPYAFRHQYPELLLQAILQSGQEAWEVARKKSQRDSLTFVGGGAVTAPELHRFIGPTDRAFFERMFALDHARMVEGGHQMLDSGSDLGKMLFQAASGFSALHKVRDTMRGEADQWWSARARKDVRYHEAEKSLQEAVKAIKATQLKSAQWNALNRQAEVAAKRVEEIAAELVQVDTQRARSKRVQRTAPRLQALGLLDAELAQLPHLAVFPPKSVDVVIEQRIALRQGNAAIFEQGRLLQDLESAQAGVAVEQSLIDQASSIEEIYEQTAAIRDTERDLPKRRLERETQRQAIDSLAMDMGVDAPTPLEVMSRLIRSAHRIALESVALDETATSSAVMLGTAELATARKRVVVLEEQLPGNEGMDAAEWDALLRDADTVIASGNPSQLQQQIDDAEATMARACRELHPWEGSSDSVNTLRAPDETIVVALLDEHDRMARAVQEHAGKKVQLADATVVAAHACEVLTAARGVPTAEDLLQARAERDGLIERLHDDPARDDSTIGETRLAVLEADGIADARYAAADAAARLDVALRDRDLAQQRHDAAERHEISARQELDQFQIRWSQQALEWGLPDIPIQRLRSWPKQLAAAQAARALLDTATLRYSQWTERAGPVLKRLNDELEGAGRRRETALSDAAAALRQLSQAAHQQRIERAQLEKQHEESARDVAAAQARYEEVVDRRKFWEQRWLAALTDASLPPQLDCRGFTVLMQRVDALKKLIEDFVKLEEGRIAPMEAKVREFRGSVAQLLDRCGLDIPTEDPHAALIALRTRAKASAQAHEQSLQRRAAIKTAQARLAQAREAVANAESVLEPLMRIGAVDSVDALLTLVQASAERERIQASRAADERLIVEGGDGLDLAALQKEVDETDLVSLSADLSALNTRAELLQADLIAAHGDNALEREKLKAVGGDEPSAAAEGRRLAALNAMTSAADHYVRAHTAHRLLDWALQRYRDEQQGPMLERASGYFASLTNGEHVKLIADTDGSTTELSSRRSDQSIVRVPGMSEGTRDQLFLALRLAGLVGHLDGGAHALPFLADDLLINCDDDRTRSSFAALLDVSQKTQVIYFTHHAHVAQLAREAFPGRCNVMTIEM